MLKVLAVGQTPPPFGGQSIMIQKLVSHSYDELEIIHVRMSFSDSMNEVGKFQLKKLLELASIIWQIIKTRYVHSVKVLYYPPAGPTLVPILRDIMILGTTRWLFDHTIFHFHAGGLSETYSKLNPLLKMLYRFAYYHADLAISLSDLNPPDGPLLQARKTIAIPYGIDDYCPQHLTRSSGDVPRILFVGVIRESKGIMVALKALDILNRNGETFVMEFVGRFESAEFQAEVQQFVDTNHLQDKVNFHGVLTGDDKWKMYESCHIFCFPTHFESETFGLVVLEAMQFSLPVVATHWRGVPSLVAENKTGFLVSVRDAQTLAERLSQLLADPALRQRMGRAGRLRYETEFTAEKWFSSIEAAILAHVKSESPPIKSH